MTFQVHVGRGRIHLHKQFRSSRRRRGSGSSSGSGNSSSNGMVWGVVRRYGLGVWFGGMIRGMIRGYDSGVWFVHVEPFSLLKTWTHNKWKGPYRIKLLYGLPVYLALLCSSQVQSGNYYHIYYHFLRLATAYNSPSQTWSVDSPSLLQPNDSLSKTRLARKPGALLDMLLLLLELTQI